MFVKAPKQYMGKIPQQNYDPELKQSSKVVTKLPGKTNKPSKAPGKGWMSNKKKWMPSEGGAMKG